MASSEDKASLLVRLDKLYEFERQPVTDDNLQPGSYFAAVFSGEHIAGTEFVIGGLFINFGAKATDILFGLLLGNLLAVLSWTLVCVPIAVQTRLTLYWYLRKIAGPYVTLVYNLLNALLYCILAGAMITVSASAIRIPFGIAAQSGWLPQDMGFVLVVFGVGAVVVALAILGFKRLAQFSAVCAPWMVLMFLVGALAVLPKLGNVDSPAAFWKIAQTEIWKGPTAEIAHPLGFWHITAFAWICNLAMHLGLSDMALFRFARRSSYGLYSAFGMFLGHYMAWACVGIMWAATLATLGKSDLDPGDVATTALGAIGAVTVVIAGWTTANPTLYRAGLALQVVTPGWPRWAVTFAAGCVTTGIACSPILFVKMLDFVALYGILLMPVGAIVVTEHWLFPRLGLTQFWSSRKGQKINWPALISWLVALALVLVVWTSKSRYGIEIIHEYFLFIPTWILTTVLYIVLSRRYGAGERLPELPPEPAPAHVPPPQSLETPGAETLSAAERAIQLAAGIGALVSLVAVAYAAIGATQATADHAMATGIAVSGSATLGWQTALTTCFVVWLLLGEKTLPWMRGLYLAAGAVAALALTASLAYSVAVFMGVLRLEHFHTHLIYQTIAYFIAAIVWSRQREKRPRAASDSTENLPSGR